MSRVPFNSIWRQQHTKLVPSSIKYGIISSVNIAARTVSIAFNENPLTASKNIPLATNILASSVSAGMRAKVDILNESRAGNMVVTAVF
jgi:hypothetical protein